MDLKQRVQNRGGAFFQIRRQHDDLGGGRSAIRPIRQRRSGEIDHNATTRRARNVLLTAARPQSVVSRWR
jgi:hypothetical protein